MRGWPDGKIDRNMAPYNCRRNELSVQGGCVLWGARVVIPPQCRQEVLHELRLAHPLHPWQWSNKPFLGNMFLVAVDATSKWIETHIMNSTTSTANVCKLRDIFAQHGFPEILISDNASNFTS